MSSLKADWLEPRAAADLIVSSVPTVTAERVPLLESRGRVLDEDIVAGIDIPRWTNSAMDGFAVHSADVGGATRATPIELKVVDDIAAGRFPRGPLARGAAARVMTGAPVPEEADSVIRVEHTDGGTDLQGPRGRVRIFETEDAGRNLRRAGEDVRTGAIALERGSLLSAGAIGVAASLGRAELSVVRRPVVALLTSGDELVEVEAFAEVLAGRRIVSSNSYTLAAQLAEAGCEVRYLGIARDTPDSLAAAVEGARGCDALVTSAGISVGEHDHVKGVLLRLGAEVLFWRVRMRPGSPFAYGRIEGLGGIPWFGLPGNPVSSMVTFELFAKPALLRMAGRREVFPVPRQARLLDDYRAPAGLTQFPRVRLRAAEDATWEAALTGPQGSGILTSLATADGLLVVPADRPGATRGEKLPVIPLGPTLPLSTTPPF